MQLLSPKPFTLLLLLFTAVCTGFNSVNYKTWHTPPNRFAHLITPTEGHFAKKIAEYGAYDEKESYEYDDFYATEHSEHFPAVLSRSFYLPPSSTSVQYGCQQTLNPNADCYGAPYVPSDGIPQPCSQHAHCYMMREPVSWCRITPTYSWTKEGCHCDKKLQTCVVNRINQMGMREYTFCRPVQNWFCPPSYDILPLQKKSKRTRT